MRQGHSPCRALVLGALLVVWSGGACALSEEAILRLRVAPPELRLPAGGRAELQLLFENTSVREVDDVEVLLSPAGSISLSPAVATREKVAPYAAGMIDLEVHAAEDTAEGRHLVALEVAYTYCIDESCFQIIETLDVPVDILPAEVSADVPAPRPPAAETRAWLGWVLPLGGLAVLGVAVVLWRARRAAGFLYAGLALVALGALALGVSRGQHRQAQGIASVLCTSCVGIEEARKGIPRLSELALARLAQLERDIPLIIFHAPWCQSCPYAEAMVEVMAKQTARISYRLVDVEAEPDRARAHGVIASGRTVVPAVLRVDTGEVVFGIEDLEARLLRLLGVGP